MKRRIETQTSRTAEWTCLSRAASALERNPYYHSGDHIAPSLVPGLIGKALRSAPARAFYGRMLAPKGMYEYVIARTRTIDAALETALAEGVEQVLILGAGFDTRALRFRDRARRARFFELDAPATQNAKIGQYRARHLESPDNLTYVAIDFDRQSLPHRLDEAGFRRGARSLFILEGVLMYLQPASVAATLATIRAYAGPGSRAVFDCVRAAVLRGATAGADEARLVRSVARANEQWRFGLDAAEVAPYLAPYGLRVAQCWGAPELEAAYFTTPAGRVVGRVNASHLLVTAEFAESPRMR